MKKRFDPGKRRSFGAECFDKGEDLRTGGLDNNTFAGIGNRADDRKVAGKLKNEGSKPHALDSAPDENFDPVF